MDYPRGLQALRACIGAGDVEALSELAVLESRLVENQRKERIFGGNETTRSEHAQVIYAPTYDALLDRMAHTDYHLIHFDGHGVFARRCPRCRAVNYPHLTTCGSCQGTLADVPAQGYLVFEDSAGAADFVSTEDMENLLLNSPVRLMFLSACQSGVVRGESLFAGLGPGLIRAGVPAVVAMQFSVPVQAAIDFVGSFYGALGREGTVSRAVAHGRRRLFRGKTWFIPTLYLRSQDDEGHIFTS